MFKCALTSPYSTRYFDNTTPNDSYLKQIAPWQRMDCYSFTIILQSTLTN